MSQNFKLSKTFRGRPQNAPQPQRVKTTVTMLPLLTLLVLAVMGVLAFAGYLTGVVTVDWEVVWAPFALVIDRVMWLANLAKEVMP